MQKSCCKLSIMGNSGGIDEDQCDKRNKALNTTLTRLQREESRPVLEAFTLHIVTESGYTLFMS